MAKQQNNLPIPDVYVGIARERIVRALGIVNSVEKDYLDPANLTMTLKPHMEKKYDIALKIISENLSMMSRIFKGGDVDPQSKLAYEMIYSLDKETLTFVIKIMKDVIQDKKKYLEDEESITRVIYDMVDNIKTQIDIVDKPVQVFEKVTSKYKVRIGVEKI